MQKFAMGAMRRQLGTTSQLLLGGRTATSMSMLMPVQTRQFRQVNDLHEISYTVEQEMLQRTAKYLELTDKVYKPSKTIEFNREG